RASLGITLLSGTHFISAFYGGDGAFFPSGGSLTERWGRPVATTVTLSNLANPAPTGFAATFSAAVAPVAGTGAPTGKVTFLDGTTSLGTAALGPPEFGEGGPVPSATLTISSLAAGTHAISAVYAGDGIFKGGRSTPFSQVIGQ